MQRGSFVKSALWTSSCRWLIKFLGVFSSAFLVRLLAPDDFGIVLKAFLFVSFFEIIVVIKFSETLVRIKKPAMDDYHTAFTLNCLLGVLMFTLVNIFAPFTSYLLNDERLPYLAFLLSIRMLFYGVENPRMMDNLREFHYGKDFLYLVIHKILCIICAIIACLYFKNYYGLIVAHILNPICLCIVGYSLIPYLPKFSLKNHKEFFDYSIPNISSHFSSESLTNLDRILPARFVSDSVLGVYNLAYELASQLTVEVIYPLARAFFPVFSEIEEKKDLLRSSYFRVLQFLIPVCMAIGAGLYVISDNLILIFAGEKWLDSIEYFKIFAIAGAAQVFAMVNGTIFAATGHVKAKSKLFTWQMILSIVLMLPFVIYIDLYKIVLVKAFVSVSFMIIHIKMGIKYYDLEVKSFLKFLIRPITATIIMFAIGEYLTFSHYALFLEIILCGIAFIATHFLLWALFSKDDEALEREIIILFKSKVLKR